MQQTIAPDATTVTVEGVELTVPLEVQASTSIVASYRVDPSTAQEIIADSGFTIRPGDDARAGLSIVGMSYLQSVFGRYNEIGIVFEVEPLGTDENANFIRWLPVTGEFSCAVGQQVWGFPKWVTDLRYTIFGDSAQVEWFENDELVLRLRLGAGGDEIGAMTAPVSSYTRGPDGPQCTETEMHHQGVVLGAPVELEIGESTHPAALALKDLGVDGLEPAMATKVSHSTSSWGLAKPR